MRRDQRFLLCLAALALLLALLQTLTGFATDFLLAVPALVVLLPLLAGRYLGEEGLARLAARFAPRRQSPRTAHASMPRPRPTIAAGSRLLASSLAGRAPPAPGPLAP
jgi:hypothetical protein